MFKIARELDDMALAQAVGVWDPNAHYQRQLEILDKRHKHRMDYLKGGIAFSIMCVFSMLLAYFLGGWS